MFKSFCIFTFNRMDGWGDQPQHILSAPIIDFNSFKNYWTSSHAETIPDAGKPKKSQYPCLDVTLCSFCDHFEFPHKCMIVGTKVPRLYFSLFHLHMH